MPRLALLLFALCLLPADVARPAQAAAERPNVLFLFTDDQRPDALEALGNPVLQTPRLDALVHSGCVIRNAYCLGADVGGVCAPSRNMLLSGRAYFRWEGRQAPADGASFPVSMKDAGYETYHHGKRGNTANAIQKRFDHDKYVQDQQDQQDRQSGEPGQTIVDAAIEFVRERDAARPFFMYLAFANPHDPRVAADKYRDLYHRDLIPLPENYMPVHPFDNGEMTVRDERLAPWPRTEDVVREHLHDYYAVISGLDAHIGRLLDALKELGLYENTIIVFSSDHGLAMGSHGLFGKQSLYEHSMKAPLVVSGPGVRQGESSAMVYLMDIYPTVCELVGAPVPDGLDGRSFAGVLRGESETARHEIFLSYRDVQRAYRDERWKLIRYPKIHRTQLFDLASDPHELHDLADEPAQQERIERMLAALAEWQQHYGDTDPLTAPEKADPTFTPPE